MESHVRRKEKKIADTSPQLECKGQEVSFFFFFVKSFAKYLISSVCSLRVRTEVTQGRESLPTIVNFR